MESIKILARNSLDFINKQYPDLVPIATPLLSSHTKTNVTTNTDTIPRRPLTQKQSLKLRDYTNDNGNSNSTSNSNDTTDIGIDIDIDPEARLFHSLNELATLLAKRKAHFADTLDELDEEQLVSLQRDTITDKAFKNTDYDNGAIAKFIRTRLLSYLEKMPFPSSSSRSVRTVLSHWWLLLLRFLDSDTDPVNMRGKTAASTSSDPAHISNTIRPVLSTDLVAVILESIQQIMSISMVRSTYPEEELDEYVKCLLLTVQFVSNRLVALARTTKRMIGTKEREQLVYCNNYTQLIRSCLGRLMAYAFVYLPDSYQFAIGLLNTISPRVRVDTIVQCGTNKDLASVFPWKNQRFTLKRKPLHTTTNLHKQQTTSTKQNARPVNKQGFEVVISYIKNDSIFMSLYWHYWYIIVENLALSGLCRTDFQLSIKELKFIPGAEVLVDYAITHFFKNDLYKVDLFLKSLSKFDPQNEIDTTSPSLDPSQSQHDSNSTQVSQTSTPMIQAGLPQYQQQQQHQYQPQSNPRDKYDNFVNKNLRIIRTWQCLKSLTRATLTLDSATPTEDTTGTRMSLMCSVLKLHDTIQLKYIRTIPAYNAPMANFIFNRILPLVVEDHDGLLVNSYIDWGTWTLGHVNLLRTLNVNSQITSLISLFNLWEKIPIDYQRKIVESVLLSTSDGLLDNLMFDATTNNLKQILFVKFLIFKVSKLATLESCSSLTVRIYTKLAQIEKQLEYLRTHASSRKLPEWEGEINSSIGGDKTLVFNGDKKFVIGRLGSRRSMKSHANPQSYGFRTDKGKGQIWNKSGNNGTTTATVTSPPTAVKSSTPGGRYSDSLIQDVCSDDIDSNLELDESWKAKKKRRDNSERKKKVIGLKSYSGNATGALCFRVMPVCRSGMSVRHWNKLWGGSVESYLTSDRLTLFEGHYGSKSSLPLDERLNLSLFKRGQYADNGHTVDTKLDAGDRRKNEQELYDEYDSGAELSRFVATITEYNLRTRLMDHMRFVRVFNLTMLEYYDYNNMVTTEPLVIDFEIFK